MALKAIALNCTLKPSGEKASSTDKMIDLIATALRDQNVSVSKTIRIADFNVKPGVTSDEGEGDDWPELRQKILDHDILILGTPVWMGQMSSVAKRVLERMDAFLGEADDEGRMPSYAKVAMLAVVGNEDGAHSVCASAFQALNDTGWTIPASAVAYWVGEAMGSVDFVDLKQVPEKVTQSATMAASNAAHLARLLNQDAYPGSPT